MQINKSRKKSFRFLQLKKNKIKITIILIQQYN